MGLNDLVSSYCKSLSIPESTLTSSRRTSEIVGHRTTFIAVVIKNRFPQALEDVNKDNPSGLLTALQKVFGRDKSGLSKIAKNARFYYKTYSGFKTEVDQIYKMISDAT